MERKNRSSPFSNSGSLRWAPFLIFSLFSFFILPPLHSQEKINIKVVEIKGNVVVKFPHSEEWKKLEKGTSIPPGSEIKTEEDSQVTLAYGEFGLTTLIPNSLLIIKDGKRKNGKNLVSLFARKGKIWSAVKKKFVSETEFNVETPNAFTGVRGTTYFVKYVPEQELTRVGVLEGLVGVKSKGPLPGYTEVPQMMATNIVSNKPPTSLEKLREEEIKEWKEWRERMQESVPLWAKDIVGAMMELDEARRVEAAMTVKKIAMAKRGEKKAQMDFKILKEALLKFYQDTGRFPTRQEGLEALKKDPGVKGWKGPYVDPSSNLLDPYGHPYQYRLKKTPKGKLYLELRSVGVDGIAGSHDDHVKLIFPSKHR
ncbi:type II secretion system protein GspG [Candidatus Calescamantes bacterium]|nr:type II secretion system protein GspG [Candidatus Calescamantes bacterium]